MPARHDPGLPLGQYKARVRIAEEIDAAKGTTSDFCDKTGLSYSAAINWLKFNLPNVLDSYRTRRRHGPRPGTRFGARSRRVA